MLAFYARKKAPSTGIDGAATKGFGNTKGTQLIVSEFGVVLLSGVCAQGLSELRIGKSMTRCHTDCPALRSGEWPQLLIPFPACSHEIAIAVKHKGDAAHCFRIWGRPLERSVCSRLKRAADWEIHDSLPYGLPCFTQRRMASTSDSVSGLFT